tara:strand:- start:70 stop:606 length:537 start_codon:yes stop_codon:yes gene_type:complete
MSDSNNVVIELDFTGKTPAGGSGLGYLTSGLHDATILEFKHYVESNRLYVYMATDGIRHRESFSLSEKAVPFIMAFLVSAGVDEAKLDGKVKFPFHKLVNKKVYFNYNAPTMGANGQPIEGSYPDYRFVRESHFNHMKTASAPSPTKAAPANGSSGVAVSPPPAAPTQESFEFLLDDK